MHMSQITLICGDNMTKVLVRLSFEIEEEWEDQYATKDHIEFYYNEGTSCADNIIKKLLNLKKEEGLHGCLCRFQDSEVVKIYAKE